MKEINFKFCGISIKIIAKNVLDLPNDPRDIIDFLEKRYDAENRIMSKTEEIKRKWRSV